MRVHRAGASMRGNEVDGVDVETGAMPYVPEAEWSLHTKHGTARCGEEPEGYLVRLADVVRWLQRVRGLPFATAVQRVTDCITPVSIMHMFYLDGDGGGWARPMWVPTAWDKYFSEDESEMPWPENKVAHCITAVRASWLMPSWELERLANHGRPAGESREYDAEKETPFEFSERRGGIPGCIAIRMRLANQLWGWGRLAASEVQPDPVSGNPPVSALEAQDVIDWPSLVRYRLQFIETPAQSRPKWAPPHVEVLSKRLRGEHESGKGLGALRRLADEIGITRQALDGLLKKHRYDAATGKKIPDAATPFAGIGSGGKQAA